LLFRAFLARAVIRFGSGFSLAGGSSAIAGAASGAESNSARIVASTCSTFGGSVT
jgi:hypothetical protein